jgi:glutamyl-Q tRNA(Asp) synthetase
LSLGDVVLARKDVPTSYHLAVTVDDHLQGVTLVTRGEDLFHATHMHRLLQALLGLRTPRYYHHNLIADSSGQRLAKRNRAITLRHLRDCRRTPDDVWRMIGLTTETNAKAR